MAGRLRDDHQIVATLPIATIIIIITLPELILQGADHELWGGPLWRSLSYQYGAFWAGLLHGWTPNYAAQPVAMFLSHAVLHVSFLHLLGNIFGILTLGPMVSARLGERGFLIVCLLAAIGGGLAFGLLSRSPQPMVGASGIVFGLAGAWAWGQMIDQSRTGQGRWQAIWPFLAISVGLALFNLVCFILLKGIFAWETHLGGYLAGIVCVVLVAMQHRER
ncbi:rhomboid family intramembrane serine protease [Tabrizicola sp. WMC-M-20]|nr:rhomboid family intramembrane serine protease [Tabrizicola sp. WMC-M-20]